MVTLNDIFKKSFLEGWAGNTIGIKATIVTLAITFLIAVYIFLCYRVLTKSAQYSLDFNLSLVGVALITSAIILTIQSSIVISLGMVGALSIVRFRTAVKNPIDLMYLFWAISVGIICGAGYSMIAFALSLFLTVSILVLSKISMMKSPLILIIDAKSIDVESDIMRIAKDNSRYLKARARNVTDTSYSCTFECRTADEKGLIKALHEVDGVMNVALISRESDG